MIKKILILSNIVHEPYLCKCVKKIRNDIEIRYLDLLNVDELEEEYYDFIIIWINYEKMMNSMLRCDESYHDLSVRMYEYCEFYTRKIRDNNMKNIIIIGFEDYYNQSYYVQGNIADDNKYIEDVESQLCRLFNDYKLIDLKKVIARIGICNTYDERNKVRWNSPYSECFYEEISKDIIRIVDSTSRIKYKCIAVDCDNVIWGGILSEQKIMLGELGEGRIYKDFQRFLLYLFHKGYLLALLSKNDESDVNNIFQSDREMVIRESNIAYFGVSWDPKSITIRKMVDFLHISPDSVVFVDDSIVEIEEMRTNCPEVKSILFDPETIYQQLSFLNVTDTDLLLQNELRTATFSADLKREDVKKSFTLNDDYLTEIGNRIEIIASSDSELKRISELSMRVNRVTNGARYVYNDLMNLYNSAYIYSVYVRDKFGDLGLVGSMIVSDDKLMLFCLSCRALGRNVEKCMVSYLKSNHKIRSYVYKNTNRNSTIFNILDEVDKDIEICRIEG